MTHCSHSTCLPSPGCEGKGGPCSLPECRTWREKAPSRRSPSCFPWPHCSLSPLPDSGGSGAQQQRPLSGLGSLGPGASPGGDPGPVVGGAVSSVDPGCTPEDTHVLLRGLVGRRGPLPHIAHEVKEPCTGKWGLGCFSLPSPSGMEIHPAATPVPLQLEGRKEASKPYHSRSAGERHLLATLRGSRPQLCHPWGTCPNGKNDTRRTTVLSKGNPALVPGCIPGQGRAGAMVPTAVHIQPTCARFSTLSNCLRRGSSDSLCSAKPPCTFSGSPWPSLHVSPFCHQHS